MDIQIYSDNDKKGIKIQTEAVELKRTLGLAGASSFVIGSIIGSGIFISPKGVLHATGSVGLCLTVWVVTGVVQLGTALCYAELGTLIPKSGGLYTYLRLGLGNRLAFLAAMVTVLVINPGALAIVMMTFAKYLVALLPTCGSPETMEKLIAAAGIFTLFVINSYSSSMSAAVTIVTTIAKLGALAVIIVGGIVVMCQGTVHELGTGFDGTSQDPGGLALALYSAIWAYSGSEALNCVTEEIKRPAKNIPRAAILGVVVVIVVYTLTNVSYLAVMSRSELLRANAVGVVFGDRVLGPAAKLIPYAVIVSTLGAANNGIYSSSRVVFAAARDRNIPDVLSFIQIGQLTPLNAMLLTVTMSLILLIPTDLGSLINYLSYFSSFFNGCGYVCLLIFRFRTMKDAPRAFKVPVIIPILMIVFNIYMVVAPLAISPRLEFVYVIASVICLFLVLYVPFIHFGLQLPFSDKLVTWIQLTMEVVPPARKLDD